MAIAAIATAAGSGAVGIVRVSGPRSCVERIVHGVLRTGLTPRVAHFLPFLDAHGQPIDSGLAILFPAPHSYTGETVLELQGHGGPVVMQMLLRRVLEAGGDDGGKGAAERGSAKKGATEKGAAGKGAIRLAEPGEFTLRAFLNDKMDLAQAEAVSDLIEASSEQAARSATRSLQGVFSQRVDALAARLLELRMLVESTLDFPEEEIDFLQASDAAGRLRGIGQALEEVLQSARQGALLRSGLHVVLTGRPNVGKSSLMNALAGSDVAIVTPVAGTTRDRLIQRVDLGGLPVNIVDTAGLRAMDDAGVDAVERIGIERAWKEVEQADVVVRVVAPESGDSGDSGKSRDAVDADLAREIDARAPVHAVRITVHNKIDLSGIEAQSRSSSQGHEVFLSAREGSGVDELRALLLRIAGFQPGTEDVFIARERHLQALMESRAALASAQAQLAAGDAGLELLAEELRQAHLSLQSITGAFSADDLLGVIFSRFCIGK